MTGKYIKECSKCKKSLVTDSPLQRMHKKCRSKTNVQKYPAKFEIIRNEVYARDSFMCQMCKSDLRDSPSIRHARHIDKNKQNCNYNNLITLCTSCHSQAHLSNITSFKVKDFTPKKMPGIKKPRKKFLFKGI